jgi:hypothetical protein
MIHGSLQTNRFFRLHGQPEDVGGQLQRICFEADKRSSEAASPTSPTHLIRQSVNIDDRRNAELTSCV